MCILITHIDAPLFLFLFDFFDFEYPKLHNLFADSIDLMDVQMGL